MPKNQNAFSPEIVGFDCANMQDKVAKDSATIRIAFERIEYSYFGLEVLGFSRNLLRSESTLKKTRQLAITSDPPAFKGQEKA